MNTSMTTDNKFSDSISYVYQNYMVPLIFESYAVDLATRVSRQSPASLLEIAAGTGVVTKEIASRLRSDARIMATDLNQPMLELAKKSVPDRRITWQQCDALALPFETKSFEAVVCQFGAMFFSDHIQAYKEANRVLKPNGRYYFNVWDQISENCCTLEVEDALAKYFPDDPPKFMSRTPHGYFDKKRIHSELEAAGFSKIEIETVTHTSKAPSASYIATAFCTGTPLRSEIEARAPGSLEAVTSYVSEALTKSLGKGQVEGKIQAIVITAGKLAS